MFAKHISDKGLVSRIHKNSHNSLRGKEIYFFYLAENLNRHFAKEDINMANKKRLNIISQTQIKTMRSYDKG